MAFPTTCKKCGNVDFDPTGKVPDEDICECNKKDFEAQKLEELLSRYWDLAYQEGSLGISYGDEANKVLHELRHMFNEKLTGSRDKAGFGQEYGCKVESEE
jgi:hypothetical protein